LQFQGIHQPAQIIQVKEHLFMAMEGYQAEVKYQLLAAQSWAR
jgi:hypothetical protein